jgi:CRISPR/Cas system CSM-associated protein Csm2 small subunit
LILAVDDQILVQLGAYEGDRQAEFTEGLKKLLVDYRKNKIKDFKTISQGIIDYRAKFNGDKTKILSLD